jgi:hypothetical protein
MCDARGGLPAEVAAVLARYGEMVLRRHEKYAALAAQKQAEREERLRRYFEEVERLAGDVGAETLASFPPPEGSGLYEVVRRVRIRMPSGTARCACDADGRPIRLPSYGRLLGTMLHVGPAARDATGRPFNPLPFGAPEYRQLQLVIDAHPAGLPYEAHREVFRGDAELAQNFARGLVVILPRTKA